MKIVVGARKSPVALAECKLVATLLTKAGAEIKLHPVETAADSLEAALKEGSGSQVFVKEVDEALARGDIDVAVHDMKDVGPVLPKGISIAAVPARDEVREAYISTKASKLAALPKGSRIGVASQVSHVQLANLRPDVTIVPMAPDLEGLLRALNEDELDALMIAGCDMKRMGFGKLIAELLPVDKIIPPIGQGALSVQVRSAEKDLTRFVHRACHHRASGLRLRAERAYLKAMESAPGAVFAAHAEIKPSGLSVIGFVSTADGADFVSDGETGDLDKAQEVGTSLAKKLLKKFSS
jgi:hydroxymethylbilane synthase